MIRFCAALMISIGTFAIALPSDAADEHSSSRLEAGILLSGGYLWGQMPTVEHDAFSVTSSYSIEKSDTGRPEHTAWRAGAWCGYTLYTQEMLTDSLEYGVRGEYLYTAVWQAVGTEKGFLDNTRFWGGIYMNDHALLVGPSVTWRFGDTVTEISSRRYALRGYFLAGPVIGTLHPFAAAHDYDSNYNKDGISTGYLGVRGKLGGGASVCFGRIEAGMDIAYSFTNIELNKKIYSTTGGNQLLHDICLEISVAYRF